MIAPLTLIVGMFQTWAAQPQRSLTELRGMVNNGTGQTHATSISLMGRIRAMIPEKGLIALEDASGAEIIEVSLSDATWSGLKVGLWVELEFRECWFMRGANAIHAGTGPVIDLDGLYSAREETNSVRLSKGFHPLRVEWFNALPEALLQVGLSGPGIDMGAIPQEMLWHRPAVGMAPKPGLKFKAYHIPQIAMLSDIDGKPPAEDGLARTISLEHAPGNEFVALVFEGLLSVPVDGNYSISLKCDDGGKVFVSGDPPTCRILPEPPADASPQPADMKTVVAWRTFSGKASFVARDDSVLRIELENGDLHTEVTVLDPSGLEATSLQGQWLTTSGVGNDEGIRVLGTADLRRNEMEPVEPELLSNAREVRGLNPDDAATGIPVTLRGVVTMANYRSLVIQDESGGVFVVYDHHAPVNMPRPGEIWSIRGRTARGDFSPMVVSESAEFVRSGAFPSPQRPRWEQMLNGSLDAEWVEIEGVITGIKDSQAELLTREGFITIQERPLYPFCRELRDSSGGARLIGSRVLFRGVFATSWDISRGRLQPGVILLGNATMVIVQPGPKDLGDVPLVEIPELWRFASKSTALTPVRLKVQTMARSGEIYVMSDGANSLRLVSEASLEMDPGDWVEVVGFPRVGTISPLLLHPVVKRMDRRPMPAPHVVVDAILPNVELDGQVVELEATVLSDAIRLEERVLELRAGNERFFAVVNASGRAEGQLQPDTVVLVRGVYVAGETGGPENPFELHLVETGALKVFRTPPWWTARRLVLLVSALIGGLALVLVWVGLLRREVTQRTSLLAIEIHEKELAESDRMLEKERARVARDLHDELGAGLTEIGMLSSLLKHSGVPEDARSRYIDTLDEVSKSLVSGLDEIVWAVNPNYDSIQDSASYLWLYAQRMLKPAGFDLTFSQAEDIPSRRFGSRRRHALFLAFKEALNNVVRHSNGSTVDLSVIVENESVVLSIADDGISFDVGSPAVVGKDGLVGMRERMRQFGGDCEIESQPGCGTLIRLVLPLRLT